MRVQKSDLSAVAGEGVFARENIPKVGTTLCLYPGIYTPPMSPLASADETAAFLANELPPSSVPPEENAYILNVGGDIGGFIDGLALELDVDSRKQRLDENPSACAHKVNHSLQANAEVIPFYWSEVGMESGENDDYFPIPNAVRADFTPWYFDGNKIHYFTPQENEIRHLCGVAICSTKPLISDEEVFLDYALKAPYPYWAADWYEKANKQ